MVAYSEIVAEPHATLPDTLRLSDRPSEWATHVLGTTRVSSFLEGPCFDRAGLMYMVDVAHGRILSVKPDGTVTTVLTYDGEPNGLAMHADGRLFVADHRRGIVIVDPSTGAWDPVVTRHRMKSFRGVNDLTFSMSGELYFTDQGQSDIVRRTGRLFRWSEHHGLELLLDGLASPNGLALSPDGSTLYLALTRENTVWRVPLRADGSLGKIGVYVHLSGGAGGPDGIAVDREGGLVVAHYGLGRVWVFDSRGLPGGHIESPSGAGTTNLAFGGDDGTTLFITEAHSATVLRAPHSSPGATLFSHS